MLGHLPYQADSSISVAIKHISDPIPQLPNGFEGLQAFFDKALAKNPDDRYPSGASLAEAFSEGLATVSPSLPRHTYDDTTMLNTASADTSAEAPVTTSANADFDAVTLADHQVNQLETAVLDGSDTLDAQNAMVLADGDGNRNTNAASDAGRGRQGDETELVVDSGKSRANDDGLSGDFMAASQATINLFFMQINRIKIFIQEPDKKLRYSLLLLALVVGVTGIFFFQAKGLAPGASQHQPLSPGQMVRVGQLLSAADQDLAAGRLLAPSGENAYEKYLAILAMSPKDPVAIEGIDKIIQRLALQAQQYLREQRASEAEAILALMRDIRPGAEQVEHLEQALASANSERVEQLTRDLQDARGAEKALEFSRAITLYQGVLVGQKRAGYEANSDVSTEVKDALERIAKASVSAAKSAAKRSDFSVAKASLGDALAAVNALGDTSVRGKARIETLHTFRDTLNQRQSEKRFSDHLSTFIASGQSALRQGHIDYVNINTAKGSTQHRQDNSAYFYFSKALEKSPSNAAAQRGLEQVYQGIAEQAKNAVAAGDFPLAQERIKRLREVAPRHADISTLRRNLKLRQREVARETATEKKIANLYQRADTYFEAGRAKSVEKIYKQIQSLAPSDSALPALKKKVADAYATLAQREVDGQDWRDANVWVERGLVYAPEHPRLLKIRAQANQKLSTNP